MTSETIAPVGFSQKPSPVSSRPQSERERGSRFPCLPIPEPEPKAERGVDDDVEFSALDPEIGAILSQVGAVACAEVAITVKGLLRK
jgi:hypothetical protein